MKNRIFNLLIVALLVFSVLVTTAQPVSAHDEGKNHGFQGVISAIDTTAGTLTVTPKKGADVVLIVDSSTVITRSQHPATLADLQLGDRVEVNYDPATMLAKRIKANPNLVPLNGTISGVDTAAGTVSVTPKKGGADVVLNLDASTQIKRKDAAATLADLKIGDLVQASYNPVTFLAASIWAWPVVTNLKGAISAVDTGAGTFSVTPKNGGADVVLHVDSSTQIMRSGAVATLADLQLGDRVEAKYEAATFLAITVSAWPNLVLVKGSISAVDSVAGTVTVTPKKGGADVILKVSTTTQIMRNNVLATLADLKAGDFILAKYNPVTFLAANIWAWPNYLTVKGTISAIDTGAGSLTVTPKGGGADVVLTVDSTTQIKRNGATATLADLQLGDSVEAKYDPASLLAVNISAWENLVMVKGTIKAIDTGAGTVTVTPMNAGADVVLKVGTTTVIMRNNAVATLADLKIGDLVQAKYNPVTFLAANIWAWPNYQTVKGTISAVDTGAGTLTVTPKGGGADVVLTVDSSTQIKRNGATVTLADLQLGDSVEAKYDQASLLAVNIWAWPNLVMVKGTITAIDTGVGTVTVTPKDGGADVILKVGSATQILRDNAAATLADLKVSDRVVAKYNPITLQADSIWAWPNLVSVLGTIKAIDTTAGTVTVTPKHGTADVVINVDSTTQIHYNGVTATLADLHVGDGIAAKYYPITMLATEIWAWPTYVNIQGTIKAVDTGASTVTITPKNGGADVVLNVDSHTMIRRGYYPAGLADLKAGDHVFGMYNQATLLATMLIVFY